MQPFRQWSLGALNPCWQTIVNIFTVVTFFLLSFLVNRAWLCTKHSSAALLSVILGANYSYLLETVPNIWKASFMVLTEVVQSSLEPRAENQLLRTCIISTTTPAKCRAGAKPGNAENLWTQEFLGKGRSCELRGNEGCSWWRTLTWTPWLPSWCSHHPSEQQEQGGRVANSLETGATLNACSVQREGELYCLTLCLAKPFQGHCLFWTVIAVQGTMRVQLSTIHISCWSLFAFVQSILLSTVRKVREAYLWL